MQKAILTLILMFLFGNLLQAEAQTNQQISIRVNQQKTIVRDKLTINFVSLLEDSRCPINANCIRAGNARLQIKVGKSKGTMKTFEINTDSQPKTISYEGYEIKLVSLDPKPRTNIRINRNGYTATFSVSKLTR